MQDPVQDFLGPLIHPLRTFFEPNSIAIIGATDTNPSVGRTITLNLLHSDYSGKLFFVHPKKESLFEQKCFKSILDVPEAIELAIIVTPAATVPAIVKDCVNKKIPSIIIISAGFKELGEPGIKLEQEILSTIHGTSTRIIGPNCLGVMNPHFDLNATFAAKMAKKGNLAFISQSGALCTSVLDWSLSHNIGFSAFVSIGSMADVHWGDLIEYLGDDPNTECILMYMETVGNARQFLSAAKKVALTKPIILIKAGKTQAAAQAAASHTGALAGSDEALGAAVSRVGILRVNHISELFDMAATLGMQPRPKGANLTILTNAGGPAVLATDEAVFRGANLTKLPKKTIDTLSSFLPAAWSHSNPVDILGDASSDAYAKTLEVLEKDEQTDGVLVILTPQDMTDPTATAKALTQYAHQNKPILASWMGGKDVSEGAQILTQASIPNFDYPDEAAKIFAMMYKHQQHLQNMYETPESRTSHIDQGKIDAILTQVKKSGRILLSEFESKEILKAANIPTVTTLLATDAKQAISAAQKIGYPVVLKLHSETITHKSDVGGVLLNLRSDEEVEKGYDQIYQNLLKHAKKEDFLGVTIQKMEKLDGSEIILGSIVDEQFGPVILFGMGGKFVEVFKDRAIGLPPLTATLAKYLMQQTKIYEVLKGVRGAKSVDFSKLEAILISFSQLIAQNPWIAECDINPLLASETHLIALDARIVLHKNEKSIRPLAIRPYPSEYVHHFTLQNKEITIRPIRAEDEPLIRKFHLELSEDSVRQAFFSFLSYDERTSHNRLIQICNIDYDQDIRLVAQAGSSIVAVFSIVRQRGTKSGELKIILIESFHGKGLGSALMKYGLDCAKQEGFKKVFAKVLNDNQALLHICKKMGFSLKSDGHYTHIKKEL